MYQYCSDSIELVLLAETYYKDYLTIGAHYPDWARVRYSKGDNKSSIHPPSSLVNILLEDIREIFNLKGILN